MALLLDNNQYSYKYFPEYYWDMWNKWECLYFNGFLAETEYGIGPFGEVN